MGESFAWNGRTAEATRTRSLTPWPIPTCAQRIVGMDQQNRQHPRSIETRKYFVLKPTAL